MKVKFNFSNKHVFQSILKNKPTSCRSSSNFLLAMCFKLSWKFELHFSHHSLLRMHQPFLLITFMDKIQFAPINYFKKWFEYLYIMTYLVPHNVHFTQALGPFCSPFPCTRLNNIHIKILSLDTSNEDEGSPYVTKMV